MKKILLAASFLIVFVSSNAQWVQQSTGTHCNSAIAFAGSNVGYSVESYWCGSQSAPVFKTTNGGATWSADLPVNPMPRWVRDVYFVDNQHGFILCADTILKTDDGGATWSRHDLNLPLHDKRSAKFVHFPDADHGYVLCVAGGSEDTCLIVKTADGGLTWTVSENVNVWNPFALSIHFVSVDTGFIGSFGMIFKTTNGGSSWSTISNPGGTSNVKFHAIEFIDHNVGFAVGTDVTTNTGYILKTTDYGDTWTSITQGVTGQFYDIEFADPSTGYAVGDSGNVLKTTDGGNNWAAVNAGIDVTDELHSVSLIDANKVFVGGQDASLTGVIYKTSGGGMLSSAFSYTINGMVVTFTKLDSLCTNFTWDFGNGTTSTVNPNPTITYAAAGTFSPCLQCTGSTAQCVTITVPCYNCSGSTNSSISENQQSLEASVFPNPTEGIVTVSFSLSRCTELKIILTDQIGRTVYQETRRNLPGDQQFDLNLSSLPAGIYAMKISSDDLVTTKKIVLQK